MTSRVQTDRFSTTHQRPPSTRPIGEFYVNFADSQFGVIDDVAATRDLIAIRYHAATAGYVAGDHVIQGGALYRSRGTIAPHAFNATEWDSLPTLVTNDTRYLRLTGGALTGPVSTSSTLTLAANPVGPLEAATKSYVDGRDALYLPLTGGALSGTLSVAGAGIAYPGVDPEAHRFGFIWNGNLHSTVDGSYIGALAFQSWVNANYLPLGGGTITGALGVNSTLHVGGTIDTNSNLYVRGGTIFFGSGDTAYLQSDGTNAALRFRSDGWNIAWDGSNGNFSYNSPSQWLFYVDSGGSGHFRGNLDLPGTLTAGAINAPGASMTVNNLSVSGTIGVAQTNTTNLTVYGDTYNAGFMQIAGGRSMSTAGWAYGTGGSSPVSGTYTFGLQVNNNVMAGAFLANSDARLKTDVNPLTPERGVLWVQRSRPVTYRKRQFHGVPASGDDAPENEGFYEAGFIAQEQIAAGFGEFVVSVPGEGLPAYDHDGVRTPADTQLALNLNNQVALLTAAMQHVLSRLDAMKDEIRP
jgi:hypothetical protein